MGNYTSVITSVNKIMCPIYPEVFDSDIDSDIDSDNEFESLDKTIEYQDIENEKVHEIRIPKPIKMER